MQVPLKMQSTAVFTKHIISASKFQMVSISHLYGHPVALAKSTAPVVCMVGSQTTAPYGCYIQYTRTLPPGWKNNVSRL